MSLRRFVALMFALAVCFSLLALAAARSPQAGKAGSAAGNVELKRDGTAVVITVAGKPFTAFFFGPDSPKPYFHPLRTATGKIITRGYPMIKDDPEEISARYQDHPHHRGLWYGHGDVNGLDFWAEGKGKGTIVFKSLDEMTGGNEGRLTATFEWAAPDGKVLLTETKKVTISARANVRIMDFEETLRAGSEAAKLGDTKEGTFALRVTVPLSPAHGGVMVNSEGASGEKLIWGKRATWVDYYGPVGGETVGVAFFDHPANPKYPTYWHSRAYGLHSANPFGERDYYSDKSRDGSITIQPNQSVTFRYRVFIHQGDVKEGKVAEEYANYVAAAKRAAGASRPQP